ncbi:MAG TPA: response regulator [Kofleriaceae bacterium]|nr:response regulator [Kofleriaceae bacterium]
MNAVVVSPDPLLAEFLRRPLEPLGHKLSAVASVAELEARIDELEPHAVFLPRRLPDRELAHAVSYLRTQLDHIAIAAIVVGVAPSDREIAKEALADGFLMVPFADSEVLEVIGATTRAKKLVLLADDSPMIHRYTRPILEEDGYDVLSANDGAEALRVARDRRPDLVITDVEMPKLDGYELCKTLKAGAETAHIPVLICSTLGEAADLERGFDAGADDYMVKPVVPEELSTRVRALFAGTLPASRERILVVDDSPAQRHFVADCLARQGFEIITAENGKIALDKAQAIRPHLVISDYEMPVMTGFELVHALRRDPELRNVPVIMLTARDSKRDMAQMRAAGASAYLVKPFAQDKCIATVERTLAERRLMAYKQASSLFVSDLARKASEERALSGDVYEVRADERVMSVMFSDLVGFTPMSAGLTPRELILLLNDYFDVMCPLVRDEQGAIDKFIGDAIMAVFDDVRGAAPAPERAVRAGLAMQASLVAFNAQRGTQLGMRIGINTGPLVVGDLGSRVVRRDYTVIGDTVNRANRYESKCKPGGVLISSSTRDALGTLVTVEEVHGLTLKGVAEPVTAYQVLSIAPRAQEPS